MKKRFYELDLLRFLAAISVLMFHFTFRGYAADNYSAIYYPVLGSIFKYGYLGVDLFFIISGFVILMTVENKTAKEFVVSRVSRLYPAFWICVSLTYFVTVFAKQELFQVTFFEYLVNLTMLNKFVGVKSVDGVYWTLAVEIRFYFWIFLFMLIKQMDKLRYLYILMLFLSGLSLWYELDFFKKIFFLEFCPYFISGCVFYSIWKSGITKFYASLLGVSYILSICHGIDFSALFSDLYYVDYDEVYVALIITSFYLIFAILISEKFKLTHHPMFFYLGISTYPLYLMHQNIGYILINSMHGNIDKHLILMVVTLFMVLLSFLIWYGSEKILTKKFKRLLEKIT